MSSYVESGQSIYEVSEDVVDDDQITSKWDRSEVWNHFTKRRRLNGEKSASCNHCAKVLSRGKGTSHLWNHVTGTCPNFKWARQVSLISPKPIIMFDKMRSRRDFAVCVIMYNYPFLMADHEYFLVFLNGLNADFKMPSRFTIRRDVIDVFLKEKDKAYQLFENFTNRVSLTTDIWTTDHCRIPYCCVTVHYIDDLWELHKKVLAFKHFPYPHDGDALFTFMKDRIMEWNLDRKVMSVVVDSASANDSMIGKLKEWLIPESSLPIFGGLFHVRCTAHVLNLIVQDGLKVVQGFLEKIRDSVRYLNKHPRAAQKFELARKQLKLDKLKSICIDVPTRWNSTFLMLETTLPLKEAFERLEDMDVFYNHKPSVGEWVRASTIHQCVSHFYVATNRFSGTKYPTANSFFPDICNIHLRLIEWIQSDNDLIRMMALEIKEKFDKYWEKCNLVLAVAVALDPRFKMVGVKFFYEKIYSSESDVSLGLAKYHTQRVHDALKELFISYGGDTSSEAGESASRVEDSYLNGFGTWYGQTQVAKKYELDEYLDEPLYPTNDKNFEILLWWKHNSARFPTLAKGSRDLLAVPATTVASESVFSVGGQVLDEYWSRLKPNVVEALIVSKDLIGPARINISRVEEEDSG